MRITREMIESYTDGRTEFPRITIVFVMNRAVVSFVKDGVHSDHESVGYGAFLFFRIARAIKRISKKKIWQKNHN